LFSPSLILRLLVLAISAGQIRDYAKKEWGGLVRSYYKKRYALFFQMVDDLLARDGDTTLYSPWDQQLYQQWVLERVELPWQTDTTTFPVVPTRDAVAVAEKMFARYAASGSDGSRGATLTVNGGRCSFDSDDDNADNAKPFLQ
jgi:hypothetical protein